MYDVFSLKDFKFPDNFLWGAGYAGHQVEGNNIYSQKWKEEQDGKYPEKSGMACNSYNLYAQDHEIAASLSMQAFRTSVEWARIEPSEGMFDEKEIEHYIKVFEDAKNRGLKVFATIIHFTVPLWFEEKGSFSDADNLKYFERFLEKIVPAIAPYVDFWNVLNEFNLSPDYSFKVNCILAHARGYHVIKKYSSAPVSTAHALIHYMPVRPHDEWDIMMTEFTDKRNNEFFFHALRTGEILLPENDAIYAPEVKGTADYWSVNFYTRSMIDSRKANLKGTRYLHKQLKLIDQEFYMGEMYPECGIAILDRLRDKPVYITENGCSCEDDRFRIVYLALHLNALYEAIKLGVDVRGYLHWSLLDNYEWGSYVPTFGLCSVDKETFERTLKPSAHFYKEIIEENGFNQDILRKYLGELPSIGLKNK